MPKRAAEKYESDDGFVEDAPKSKKSKQTKSAKAAGSIPDMQKNKEGAFWEISGKRRLQVSEFKGQSMVGIREYYEKDGEMLPGKKGISLTLDQFDTIVQLLPQVESALKAQGNKDIARPTYDGKSNGAVADEPDDEEEAEAVESGAGEDEQQEFVASKAAKSKLDKFKHKSRLNHEATSDEDEE